VVSVDLSLVFQILLMILFIITMNGLLYKPFLKIMNERKSRLEGMKRDAENSSNETRCLSDAFSTEIKAAAEASRARISATTQESESDSRMKIQEALKFCEAELSTYRKNLEAELDQEKLMTEQRIANLSEMIRRKLIPGLLACFLLTGGIGSASSPSHAEDASPHESDHGGISELARTVDFVLMAGLLVFLLRKPVGAALTSRINTIRDSLETSRKRQEDAQIETTRMRERMQSLPVEKSRIEQNTAIQVDQIKDSYRQMTVERIEKMQQDSKRQLRAQFIAAQKELRRHISQEAIHKVRLEFEKGLTVEADRKMVGECIDQMNEFFRGKGGAIHV